MRNIHLPGSVYEHLPKIYLLLALLLLVTPVPTFKWLVIAALLVGTVWIKHLRRKYREALRLRESDTTLRKYKAGSESSPDSRSSVVVL